MCDKAMGQHFARSVCQQLLLWERNTVSTLWSPGSVCETHTHRPALPRHFHIFFQSDQCLRACASGDRLGGSYLCGFVIERGFPAGNTRK